MKYILEISNQIKAQILVDALPYIQQYNGKVIVVKYGGNAMTDEDRKQSVIRDVILLSLIGIKVVLVHGGGPEISETLRKMGKESKFIGGLRYTDKETAGVVQMVLAGKTNKDLVSLINQQGGKAIGLCGLDGGMLKAKKLQADSDLGYVGEVGSVDATIIEDSLANGYIPIIASVAADENGDVYNVNADTAAASIAAALRAEDLIILSDIKGLLRDKNDESTLISVVKISEVNELIAQGIISGGMIPKVDCCVGAVKRGVCHSFIIDGTEPHSIIVETLSNEGIGTMFTY